MVINYNQQTWASAKTGTIMRSSHHNGVLGVCPLRYRDKSINKWNWKLGRQQPCGLKHTEASFQMGLSKSTMKPGMWGWYLLGQAGWISSRDILAIIRRFGQAAKHWVCHVIQLKCFLIHQFLAVSRQLPAKSLLDLRGNLSACGKPNAMSNPCAALVFRIIFFWKVIGQPRVWFYELAYSSRRGRHFHLIRALNAVLESEQGSSGDIP